MGNATAKHHQHHQHQQLQQLRPKLDGSSPTLSGSSTCPSSSGVSGQVPSLSPTVFLRQKEVARKKKCSSGSSSSSDASSSQDFIDADSEFHSSSTDEGDPENDLEELLVRTHGEFLNRTREDAFMKAVLSFCAHMGGRMDSLDNARLYDEFCSYAAAHRPNLGVV